MHPLQWVRHNQDPLKFEEDHFHDTLAAMKNAASETEEKIIETANHGHHFVDLLFKINPDDLTKQTAVELNNAIKDINNALDHLFPMTAKDRVQADIPKSAGEIKRAALLAAKKYTVGMRAIDPKTYTHKLSDHIDAVQNRIGPAMKHIFGVENKTS